MNARNSSTNNSTHSEPTSPLTASHDETLKAELAAGIIQGLDGDDVRDEVARKNRWWNKLNQKFAEDRAGVSIPEETSSVDGMGKTVRIDSDDIHHHYPPQSVVGKALPWIAAAALGLGGAGLTYLFTRPDKPAVTTPAPSDSDTSVTIEGR